MSIVITYLALSVLCVPRRWEGRYVSLAWRVESLGEKQFKGQGMYLLFTLLTSLRSLGRSSELRTPPFYPFEDFNAYHNNHVYTCT